MRRAWGRVLGRRALGGTAGGGGVLGRYNGLVASRQLRHDEHQVAVVRYLDRLRRFVEEEQVIVYPGQALGAGGGQAARGLYIYGQVGTGKTLLMDLFFSSCNIDPSLKRRVHFHSFMLEVHKRIWAYKQELLRLHGRDVNVNLSSERDAIAHVARAVSAEARVLCFDEFQVTDIADAMILSKFFSVLWQQGTVLVATSNRPPEDLYKDGLNRSYFLPFLAQLESRSVVLQIGGQVDYRLLDPAPPAPAAASASASGQEGQEGGKERERERERVRDGGEPGPAFFTPDSDESRERLWRAFGAHGTGPVEANYRLPISPTRSLVLAHARPRPPRALAPPSSAFASPSPSASASASASASPSASASACFCSFSALCEGDLGAADYSALAAAFDCVFLTSVPRLSVLEHDKARRFITLVDTLYDRGCGLAWTADEPPGTLFRHIGAAEAGAAAAAAAGAAGTGAAGAAAGAGAGAALGSGGLRLGTDHQWGVGAVGSGTGSGAVAVPEGWRRTSAVNASKFGGFALSAPSSSSPQPPPFSPHVDTGITAARMAPPQAQAQAQKGQGHGQGQDDRQANERGPGQDAAQDELKLLEGELCSVQELAFAFRRAASRLHEMGSRRGRWR